LFLLLGVVKPGVTTVGDMSLLGGKASLTDGGIGLLIDVRTCSGLLLTREPNFTETGLLGDPLLPFNGCSFQACCRVRELRVGGCGVIGLTEPGLAL